MIAGLGRRVKTKSTVDPYHRHLGVSESCPPVIVKCLKGSALLIGNGNGNDNGNGNSSSNSNCNNPRRG